MAAERDVTYDDRVIALREAIDQLKAATNLVRVATHRLVDADLQGSRDVVAPQLYQLHKMTQILESQYRELLASEGAVPPQSLRASRLAVLAPGHKGRRRGVDVIPGSVRAARTESGLSLAELAGGSISRVAIWYVEQGRTRPSMQTLELIAARTGKPIEFFTGASA